MVDISSLIEQYIQATNFPPKDGQFANVDQVVAFGKQLQDQFSTIIRAIGDLSSIIKTDGNGLYFLANDGIYRPPPTGSGSGSSSNKVTYPLVAGATINGGKALMIDTDGKVYPFDISNPYHYDKYIGVAETAASIGSITNVIALGETNYVGSGWLPGKAYYISSTGFLSNTVPSSGLVKQVGVGINTDIINIVSNTQVIKL